MSALRTRLKSFREKVAGGKKDDASKSLPELYAQIVQAVRKGVLRKIAAARHKSRLTKRLQDVRTEA